MPEIQDAALARALQRRYFLKGGYSPVLAPEVVPVVLVDDISGYETQVGAATPGVVSATVAAVAGQYGHASLAPLAGQIAHVNGLVIAAATTAFCSVRLGAPLTGGTAVGALWADRRKSGVPPVDWRYVSNAALQGTAVINIRHFADYTTFVPLDFWLTNSQGLLVDWELVNQAFRVSLSFSTFDEVPVPG
jgi:hypothetical protein